MPYTQHQLYQILHDIIHQDSLEESLKQLEKHSKTVSKLQKAFAKKIQKNKSTDPNFFELCAKYDGINKYELSSLPDQIKTASQKLQKEIPNEIKQAHWYLSIFNPFNFDDEQKIYDIQKEVFQILENELKTDKKLLDRIVLKQDAQVQYSQASFDKDRKNVVIKISSQTKLANDLISFAHECGHALDLLETDKEEDVSTKTPNFEQEKRAIQTEYNVAKKVRGVYPSLVGSILSAFRDTYFEYLVYHQDKVNLEETYAEATNIVLGKNSKIKKNPLYVFDNFLLEWPCYSTNYTVSYLCLLNNKILI